jgi:hypothetical protein
VIKKRSVLSLLVRVGMSLHILTQPALAQNQPPSAEPKLPPLEHKDSTLRDPRLPQLKFNKQDFVPIPDMVEIPLDTQ